MQRPYNRHRIFCVSLLAFFTATAGGLAAVNSTWTNALGGSWGTAANWNPNTVPAAGTSDVANFTNTALSGTITVTNASSQGAATILFSGSANYVLTNTTGPPLLMGRMRVLAVTRRAAQIF